MIIHWFHDTSIRLTPDRLGVPKPELPVFTLVVKGLDRRGGRVSHSRQPQ